MNPVLGLAAARILVGAGSVAFPELGAKLFRLDANANPQLPYMTRLFGSREIVLGAATLVTKGSTRRNLVMAGAACDASDAVAAALAHKTGAVSLPTALLLGLPAIGAVAAGIDGARRM